jgi:type VI secretion system secreted protein VgrG
LAALLAQHHIPCERRLSAEYPALELRTQYAETDLGFFCRLAEEAGISFWLEDDGLKEPRVILHDAPQGQAEGRPPLAFADDTSLAFVSQSPFATKLAVTQESMPGLATARDHDFWRPRVPLYAQAASDRPAEAEHEQYSFLPSSSLAEAPPGTRASRPTGVDTPVADDLGQARFSEAHGQRRARERMESMQAERVLVTFETNVIDLPPGTVFRVTGHPRLDVSTKTLLALRVSLEGEVAKAETWRFACEAAFTDLPHRPALVTPKPRIYGVHTAVVVGPKGAVPEGKPALDAAQTAARLFGNEEIYVDEHGRVRVQFPWDRNGAYDGGSSIWMRVSQGWAGMGYGMFTIPRIGHEVLVAFVDGDPDSPLIVGTVHNGLMRPPHKLPENRTVSTWKSASSPGGAGFNELRFDDAAGREHVYLQAERDMDQLVKRDHKVAVGRDENRYVEGDRGTAVGGSQTRFVNHNEVEATGMNRVTHTGMSHVRSVGVEESAFVGQRWSVTIGRGMARKLARKLDSLASDLGGVLRTTATGVLGALPGDPLGAVAEATLTGFGRAAYDKFKDAIGVLSGMENDAGPLPTSIQMVDRQIKLTTGEATVLLDGPNITFLAAGKIAFHAGDDVVITGEKEVAVASRGDLAVVSAEKDIVVQAGKNVHLNPHLPGSPLTRIRGRGGEPKKDPEKIVLCTLHGEGQEHPLGDHGVCTMGFSPEPDGDGTDEE